MVSAYVAMAIRTVVSRDQEEYEIVYDYKSPTPIPQILQVSKEAEPHGRGRDWSSKAL